MAPRLHSVRGASVLPFDQLAPLLRVVPSLPRPVLVRLTERLIERLDMIDGDPEEEDEDEDCCEAGDDEPACGPAPAYRGRCIMRPGDDVDAEPSHTDGFSIELGEDELGTP